MQTIDSFFKVTAGYLKAQLIFFLINFVLISIFLWIFKVPLPVLIALGICILDVFPVLGSGLVFVPWSIICFVTGNSWLGWRLAILYIGLVVLRQILEPIITGKQIGIGPLATLVVSLLGLWLFGGLGMIIAPIIAAVFYSVYRVRRAHAESQNNYHPPHSHGDGSKQNQSDQNTQPPKLPPANN